MQEFYLLYWTLTWNGDKKIAGITFTIYLYIVLEEAHDT